MDNFNKVIRLDEFINKNIISLDRGRVISSIDLNKKPGNYPVYSSSSQKNGLFGAFNDYDFDEELITWSVDGGGYFFYRPKHRFSVTNVSGILRILDKSKLDYKFLYYLLDYQHSNQLYDYVDKAHPSIIKKRYFIPELQLCEQSKIAEILSKIDNAISQTERIISKYNRIKTGLIKDLLTKGIDNEGDIRSEYSHKFKNSCFGKIPIEWELKKLDAISKISSGLTLGNLYLGTGTTELPYLRVANVQDGFLDLKEIKYIKVLNSQIEKHKLKVGDVLMNEGGDYDKLGRGTIWQGEIENCLHQNHVFKVRVNRDYILPEYLSIYSSSFYGKSFFLVSSKQSTNLASINISQLKKFTIILPDIEEQKRIIAFLSKYTNLINVYENKLNKLISTKTGLMQDLLSGKKRVTHLIN